MEENTAVGLAHKIISQTNQNLFLTGKAGTGKTTFLKNLVNSTHKKCIVAAPTGIAAINASGVTLHSLFQLPFGCFIPETISENYHPTHGHISNPKSLLKNLQLNANKRALLQSLELLIIDEVSMLRADLLDAIDTILKYVRKSTSKAFGGVQVIFIGDLLQLPPVVRDHERQILRQYYHSNYFFDAHVLRENKPFYIELEKVYRQSDSVFISILNNLRMNKITENDLRVLNAYYFPDKIESSNKGYITLTTHNAKADKLNRKYLDELKTSSYYFKAIIEREFNENSFPVESNLELKVGAQVMFVKNDTSGLQRFFNGKIGKVHSLHQNEIYVKVEDLERPIKLEPYKWQNLKYNLNEVTKEIEEQEVGSFTQFPIKLAWAITVHKSQGLTFENAIIDIEDVFAPGQAYVALSRLKSLSGLILSAPLSMKNINTDLHVEAFSNTKDSISKINQNIEQGSRSFLFETLVKHFSFSFIQEKFQLHLNSYQIDKKKSSKAIHKAWVEEIYNQITQLNRTSDKFILEIQNLFHESKLDYSILMDRIHAAINYFSPILNDLNQKTYNQIKNVKVQKKVKTYLEELIELDLLIFEKDIELQKAIIIVNAFQKNDFLSKEQFKGLKNRIDRQEFLAEAIKMNPTAIKSKKQLPKGEFIAQSEDLEQEMKVASKDITLQLYKDGLAIEEISQVRNMATSTIEGHLIQFVSKGEIDGGKFVSQIKKKNIITAAKKLNSFKLAEIKSVLSDEYSYSEIKFAIASYLANGND